MSTMRATLLMGAKRVICGLVSIAIVLLNLVVDIVYTFLDPRVRESSGFGGVRVARRLRRE